MRSHIVDIYLFFASLRCLFATFCYTHKLLFYSFFGHYEYLFSFFESPPPVYSAPKTKMLVLYQQ